MLSGIGDPSALRDLGIAPRVALSGVGRNLQDHASVAVEFARRGRGPFVRHMRADRLVTNLARAYVAGSGFATDLPSGWTAFLKTPRARQLPDIQLIFRAVPLSAAPWFPGLRPPFADGFAVRALLLRPESRGQVTLRSADPAAKVRIVQNLLRSEADRKTLQEGLRLIREVAERPETAAFIERELAPGPGGWTDTALAAHVLRSVATAHHPAGTCRMGPHDDAASVVDAEFAVRGTRGLHVVDASVLPDLVGSNLNASVVMLAELAADILAGRSLLPRDEALEMRA